MFVIKLVKLHGLEFHGRKIIIEEAKRSPRTLVNKLLISAVANDQQSMHKMLPTINKVRSKLPTAPTEEQYPIQNIISTFSNAVIAKKKNLALVSDSIPRGMKMKHHKDPGEGRKNTLKIIPLRQSQSAESLRHSQRQRNSIMTVL